MSIEKNAVQGGTKKSASAKRKMKISAPRGQKVSSMKTLNIGSQSTGAGAGKITFNPFSITRK